MRTTVGIHLLVFFLLASHVLRNIEAKKISNIYTAWGKQNTSLLRFNHFELSLNYILYISIYIWIYIYIHIL